MIARPTDTMLTRRSPLNLKSIQQNLWLEILSYTECMKAGMILYMLNNSAGLGHSANSAPTGYYRLENITFGKNVKIIINGQYSYCGKNLLNNNI